MNFQLPRASRNVWKEVGGFVFSLSNIRDNPRKIDFFFFRSKVFYLISKYNKIELRFLRISGKLICSAPIITHLSHSQATDVTNVYIAAVGTANGGTSVNKFGLMNIHTSDSEPPLRSEIQKPSWTATNPLLLLLEFSVVPLSVQTFKIKLPARKNFNWIGRISSSRTNFYQNWLRQRSKITHPGATAIVPEAISRLYTILFNQILSKDAQTTLAAIFCSASSTQIQCTYSIFWYKEKVHNFYRSSGAKRKPLFAYFLVVSYLHTFGCIGEKISFCSYLANKFWTYYYIIDCNYFMTTRRCSSRDSRISVSDHSLGLKVDEVFPLEYLRHSAVWLSLEPTALLLLFIITTIIIIIIITAI